MGVEVGGAVKNVIAIGSGIADGMGFGANTRVALITRGLAEMMRLGVRLGAGARPSWVSRVSVIWCSPAPTINPAIDAWGWRSAAAHRSPDAARDIHQVVEGVEAACAVRNVAERLGVEMPICREVYRVMHEGKPVREALQALMAREVRSESD